MEFMSRGMSVVLGGKVFNFGITKISATTEITEFREIQPKFRQNIFRD